MCMHTAMQIVHGKHVVVAVLSHAGANCHHRWRLYMKITSNQSQFYYIVNRSPYGIIMFFANGRFIFERFLQDIFSFQTIIFFSTLKLESLIILIYFEPHYKNEQLYGLFEKLSIYICIQPFFWVYIKLFS
jgi:hypothetical protein